MADAVHDFDGFIASRFKMARLTLRQISEWQESLPENKRLKLTPLLAHLESMAQLIQAGKCDAARKLHENFTSSPAALLGRRKRSVVEIRSEKKRRAAQANGRKRLGKTGWAPVDVNAATETDDLSWQDRQAAALLKSIMREGANSAAFAAVANHAISIRVERSIFKWLQNPSYSAASVLLPSRWKPRATPALLFRKSAKQLNRLKRFITTFCDKGRDQPIELEARAPGALQSEHYGPFASVRDVLVPDNVYDAARLLVRIEGAPGIALPGFISPDGRRLRQFAKNTFGRNKPIYVRLSWRATGRMAHFGPFASHKHVNLPWSELQEAEVFIQSADSPLLDTTWTPVPLPKPKCKVRLPGKTAKELEKDLLKTMGPESILLHHHRICVMRVPHTPEQLARILNRVDPGQLKSFAGLVNVMVHQVCGSGAVLPGRTFENTTGADAVKIPRRASAC